ncbi:hypothetical protein [Actinomadura hibisca]|uniref:hypothetical protein n=1 Tax=Actinomadura hibisca TaxID=68565 RepID=UPI0008314227|nr:hypothetical protein [Actinomadura hibisca]
MTPGSLVLLHAPLGSAAAWGDLPEMVRSYGLDVIAPDVPDAAGARYVARASLIIAASYPSVPLVLAGYGAAGPLLPAIALAQRAAHRKVGGYVFIDAELPQARRFREHEHDHDHGPGNGHASGHAHGNGHAHGHAPGPEAAAPPVPVHADWPDAPCGYLRTHAERTAAPRAGAAAREQAVKEARLRGWPVAEHQPPAAVAQTLSELIARL